MRMIRVVLMDAVAGDEIVNIPLDEPFRRQFMLMDWEEVFMIAVVDLVTADDLVTLRLLEE